MAYMDPQNQETATPPTNTSVQSTQPNVQSTTVVNAVQPTQQSQQTSQMVNTQNQFQFWAKNNSAFSGYKRAIANFYPGWVIVTDASTGQEMYRFSLSKDMKVSFILSGAAITYMNGQKISYKDSQYVFYFSRTISTIFSVIFTFPKYLEISKLLKQSAGKQA
jgi:hypothetical protein